MKKIKLFRSAIELFFNFMSLIRLEKLQHVVHRSSTKNHKENEFIIRRMTVLDLWQSKFWEKKRISRLLTKP